MTLNQCIPTFPHYSYKVEGENMKHYLKIVKKWKSEEKLGGGYDYQVLVLVEG